MNEITRIHLGRQPFTIAVDAHKALREYLESIRKVVGGSRREVIEEIELRMAELLLERGITPERTVLVEDVDYLKEQLGKPGDFEAEEGDEESPEANDNQYPRRLFRDEKNGMVAGVCSGLATYFNVDVVMVRLVFVLLTIIAGWGVLLYIILWIVVPPAKTNSDRLQMRGKAINVDNLSEIVNREVTAAVGRAKKAEFYPGEAIRGVARALLVITGIGILVGASITLFGMAVAAAYVFTHQSGLIHGAVSFPVGVGENILTICAFMASGIILIWLLLVGVAMVQRKWKMPGWVTAAAVGLFVAVVGVATVVAPDVYHTVHDRYRAAEHAATRQVKPFEEVDVKGNLSIQYEESDLYKIEIRYFGNQDPDDVKTKVSDDKLTIDAAEFVHNASCDALCIETDYPKLVIYAPSISQINLDDGSQLQNIEDGDRHPAYKW